MFVRNLRDGIFALWSHLWAAYDVSRRARGDTAPQLTDLLAGGERKGFFESADTFYAIGFINIQRGLIYRLEIPAVSSFYTAISLHSSKQQSSIEYFNDNGDNGASILLADGVKKSEGLDTSIYQGMTQLMIRQYFWSAHQVDGSKMPQIERLKSPTMAPSSYIQPARMIAGMRFFGWRIKMLLGTKYIQFRMKQAKKINKFYSQEEAASLWTSIKTSVSRLGMTKFRYLICMYEIHEDEVLRIDYRQKGSHYFAFCLHNNWMQGINVKENSGHLNSSQIRKGGDGSYTVHVGSHSDGYDNFMNVSGYRSGIIAFREISSSNNEEVPSCRVISGSCS